MLFDIDLFKRIAITVSIGVADYRPHESRDQRVTRCDRALYRAKDLGRNRTVLAD